MVQARDPLGDAGRATTPDSAARRPHAPTHERPLVGAVLVLAAASLWGTLGLFGKSLYASGLTAVEVASARAAVGFLGLAVWFAPRPRVLRVAPRDLPLLAAYGVVGYALFETLYFATLQHTSVALAAAMLYTAPAFVLVIGWTTRQERFEGRRLLPLALVMTGVFLVTGAARALLTGDVAVSWLAAGLGLASGFTYGLFTWFGKLSSGRLPPTVLVFYVFLFSTVALSFAAPPWLIVVRHPGAVWVVVALGLVPTLGAYILYQNALHHVSASSASMLASVEPVVAALLGYLLLGERLAWERVLGIGVIVAAAALLGRMGEGPAGIE